MRIILVGIILAFVFATILTDHKNKIYPWELCKEGLFVQFLLNKCTPRNSIKNKMNGEDI
tara:strand:- start:240 stop:419 length:180 start_codon:yes stop_codon:yes gene_type:complete